MCRFHSLHPIPGQVPEATMPRLRRPVRPPRRRVRCEVEPRGECSFLAAAALIGFWAERDCLFLYYEHDSEASIHGFERTGAVPRGADNFSCPCLSHVWG